MSSCVLLSCQLGLNHDSDVKRMSLKSCSHLLSMLIMLFFSSEIKVIVYQVLFADGWKVVKKPSKVLAMARRAMPQITKNNLDIC